MSYTVDFLADLEALSEVGWDVNRSLGLYTYARLLCSGQELKTRPNEVVRNELQQLCIIDLRASGSLQWALELDFLKSELKIVLMSNFVRSYATLLSAKEAANLRLQLKQVARAHDYEEFKPTHCYGWPICIRAEYAKSRIEKSEYKKLFETALSSLKEFTTSDDISQPLDLASSRAHLHLASTIPEPQHSRVSQRRVLPMLITGKLHDAIPDTGSADNVVSEAFARSLGATLLARNTSEKYHNACGKAFDSHWTMSLPCAFPEEPGSERICDFSVVSGLAVPLVMGSRFLEITKTLTRFRKRLVRVANKALTSWRLLHVQIPRRQLRCVLDGNVTFANADTGSNVDLVSLEYAQRRKWNIRSIPDDISVVELADGTLRKLAGRVRCRFNAGDTNRTKTRKRTFYVLPGLTSDVLLGDDTLDEINAFEAHTDDFKDIEVDFNPVDLIYWAGDEGWPSMQTLVSEARSDPGSDGTNPPPPQNLVWKKRSVFSFRKKPKIWTAREILGNDLLYEKYVDRVANHHEREKDKFERKISKLAGPAKSLTEQEELVRCQEYDELRRRVRDLHEQRKAACRA